MHSNIQHILDLCSLYYPSHPAPSLRQSTLTSTPITKSLKLQLTPYPCCGETFSELSNTLVHFFEKHFPVIKDSHIQMQKTLETCVIGNKDVPIVQRAAALLKLIDNPPSNPIHFRPAPHSKSPLEFKNPYTSATALAYDFMQVLKLNPMEYSKFTFMLSAYTSISDHHDTWPYWAYYLYPSLWISSNFLPKDPIFQRPLLPAPNQSPIAPPSLRPRVAREFKSNEFKCPFKPCAKAYTSTPGFRTHMLKHHLQKRHFKADLTRKPTTDTFTCPTRRCQRVFDDEADLRSHILSIHFSTFSKKSK